jgi:Uma2 family endonuclease
MARTATDHFVRGQHRLLMTYEEYRQQIDESSHAEWVDGEVTIFMPPGRLHQQIVLFLARLLADYVDEFRLGEIFLSPFEMKLRDGRSYREPDLLFVRTDRRGALDEIRLVGPADLAIEIVSEESVERDWSEKFREYESAGLSEYWIVDIRAGHERVAVFSRSASGQYVEIQPDEADRVHSSAIPGLWIVPAWFFTTPRPHPRAQLHLIAPDHF